MTTRKVTTKRADTAPLGELIASLRMLMPARKLQLFEHMLIAERQATRLHQLLGASGPAADLGWVLRLDNVQLVLQPRWKMGGISGLTTWDDGRWVIGINKSHPQARRRFTLSHEVKHLLDANRDKITYAGITDDQRELIANFFAACYLMPLAWMRKSWMNGLRDPEALAGLFKVSREAMDKRLSYLGFVDATPDRPVATYFRARTNPADLAA
jgi:predicted transcriptional regulator